MTSGPHTAEQKLNRDVPWDAFDPREYIGNNYLDMKAVDEEIVSRVRDHFSDHFGDRLSAGHGRVAAGIDVGAGPNLYPALAMLPFLGATSGGLGAFVAATTATLLFRRRRD